MWTAAILTGGQARRLGGGDKSALRVGTGSILDRQLAVLRSLTPHILIIGPPSPGLRRTAREDVDIRVVQDRMAAGALGGLYTALMEAPTEQVLVFACDMPFISAPFVTWLAAAGLDVDAAVPRDAVRQHPLCASYQRRIAGHLKQRIDAGALRIADALRELDVRDLGPDELCPFDRDGRLLLNINTPDDYHRAQLAAERDGS